MERPNEKIQYGITVAEETIKYGAVGYIIKLLYDVQGSITMVVANKANNVVDVLEDRITNPLIEHTKPVGTALYQAEKWHGKFWSKVLGQTEEKQAARRAKYLGIEGNDVNVASQNLQAIVSQPSNPPPYQNSTNHLEIGNFILAASIVLGAIMGHHKAKKEYNKRGAK